MLSFQSLYSETQAQVGDTSAASLIIIKRAINQGAKKFGAVLSREWRNTSRTFNTVANQQYYTAPEDCIRIKSVKVTIGGITYPLTEVVDEATWNELNMDVNTSDIPEFYYIRGDDEVGIWPIPSSSNASAGTFRYERKMRDMSADDYTAGTIAVTAASAAIVGTTTTFTAAMVGRYLRINDPEGDGFWYKITSFTDATHITLDRPYNGSTASGQNYTIGEMPDIPEEYHENLIDWGCYRYYLRRKERSLSREFNKNFEDAIIDCKGNYSSKSSSQYFKAIKTPKGYVHNKRDYMVT